MNILRLVQAEKEKKNKSPSVEYQKLEAQAAANSKSKGDPQIAVDKADLRKSLAPVQYFVTQERGTEK